MSESEAVQQAQQAASTPAPASAAEGPKKGAAPGYSTDTEVANMTDLREKAPEVFDAMMKGLAQSIISRMRRQQEHLKKMWREGRDRR